MSGKDRTEFQEDLQDVYKRQKENGKVCGLLSIEGGEAIEGSLRVLRTFYRLGVRAVSYTHLKRLFSPRCSLVSSISMLLSNTYRCV